MSEHCLLSLVMASVCLYHSPFSCFLNFHERWQHVWWSGMKWKAESRFAGCVPLALMKGMLQWLQQSAEEETCSSGDCRQSDDPQCLLRRLARSANYRILTRVCDSVSVRTRGCSWNATLSVSAVTTSPNCRSERGDEAVSHITAVESGIEPNGDMSQ